MILNQRRGSNLWIGQRGMGDEQNSSTHSSHTKSSLSKIRSKGWIAQKPLVDM